VKENYPGVNIDREMLCGTFMDELQNIASDDEAALIVMGAGWKI
jgi:nucleotide-binding universal stress UspA family protein